MSLIQAILIGLMSCTAASTIACLGTTVGNYTLNRPLVASLFVGLILGDVPGCILVGMPMQVMWIALVLSLIHILAISVLRICWKDF